MTLKRPRATLLTVLLAWVALYGSFTLVRPALLDDADSVHAEVAREMLVRHDYVTLYANGIRYLEKAPLMYWSMAGAMRVSQALGHDEPDALAVAARVPLALAVLALAFVVESLARRMFGNAQAGLYAALIVLSAPGIFLFTRLTLPDIGVCLWTAWALKAFWESEQQCRPTLRVCAVFAMACALNVLTKGLIGLVFPAGIAAVTLAWSRGVRGAWVRVREYRWLPSLAMFLLIAAPWHVLAGLANPGHGHPEPFRWVQGHWQVPLPTDGNVRGWFWFYFMNEHLLRYLNLRVPHDYDTSPLWLFWGLIAVWLMPWSGFLWKVTAEAVRGVMRRTEQAGALRLLLVWAAFVPLFFALSSRQEYYVLPSLPAMAILVAGWLARTDDAAQRATVRISAWMAVAGAVVMTSIVLLLWHAPTPAQGTDLATLLNENPGNYALSMGHFLDLNLRAVGMFRAPLELTALAVCVAPVLSAVMRANLQRHAATMMLFVGSGLFLVAVHRGLVTFSPVLSSAQMAKAIASEVQPQDVIVIHGEYESGSTLGFYLQRNDLRILEGRSSNLWYGSFFPDAPPIFLDDAELARLWAGPQRVFLWQATTADAPQRLPVLPGAVYSLVKSGGKMVLSNQPNR